MKLPLPLFSLLAALAFAAALPAQTEKPAAKEESTELGEKMDKLNSAYRKLRRSLEDPAKNAESLELLAVIRQHAVESTELVPAKAADLPEAARAEFVAAYKDGMKELVVEVDKLSAALKANDNAEATAIFKGLGAMQKKAHTEFRKKKKE